MLNTSVSTYIIKEVKKLTFYFMFFKLYKFYKFQWPPIYRAYISDNFHGSESIVPISQFLTVITLSANLNGNMTIGDTNLHYFFVN